MNSVSLPWPPAELSPNARVHRASAMRLEKWRQAAATDDAIRHLKAAGASIETIMLRLGVSRTYATRIAGRRW